MKLINATPSPYGRKVAIALKEKGISYDVQYDVPWAPETCVGEYSPMQQLPILLTDEGQAIYDSAYTLAGRARCLLSRNEPAPPSMSWQGELVLT